MGIHPQSIYKHYKGGYYRIIALATYSEDINEQFVIYEALYPNEVSQVWARPVGMFLETVEVEGQILPRFALQEKGNVCL